MNPFLNNPNSQVPVNTSSVKNAQGDAAYRALFEDFVPPPKKRTKSQMTAANNAVWGEETGATRYKKPPPPPPTARQIGYAKGTETLRAKNKLRDETNKLSGEWRKEIRENFSKATPSEGNVESNLTREAMNNRRSGPYVGHASAASDPLSVPTATRGRIVNEGGETIGFTNANLKPSSMETNWEGLSKSAGGAFNEVRDAIGGRRSMGSLFKGEGAVARGAILGVAALPAGFAAINAFNSIRDKNYGAALGWTAATAGAAYGARKLMLGQGAAKLAAKMIK